jgi:uncharacterized protein (TIGR03437 family)
MKLYFISLVWCAGCVLTANVAAQMPARLLGRLDPFPEVHNRYADVWGEGNMAYLASYAGSGVIMIDISDPRNPRQVGMFDTPAGSSLRDVIVIHGIGFFSSDDGQGVYIVDVKDPANPRVLSRITEAEQGFRTVHEMHYDNGFLIESDSRTSTIKIFDVRDPAKPSFKWNVTVNTTGEAVHNTFAQNGRMYTSGIRQGTMDVYDISDLANAAPRRLGTFNVGNGAHSAWVTNDGKILASARETIGGDIRLFDVSDGANPKQLSTITPQSFGLVPERDGYSAHNPMIVGNLLFVAWYQAGTQVWDINDPANPKHLGGFDTFPDPVACPRDCFGGNWGVYPMLGLDRVLLSDLDGGLFVVDFSALIPNAKTVSAASYNFSDLAPNSIAAAFGTNLANATLTAGTIPLPTSLGSARITVQDVAGVERNAPLYFVSANQINFQIPPGTKPGPVLLKFTDASGRVTQSATTIQPAAPSIFTFAANGQGAAAAIDAFTNALPPFALTRMNGEPNIIALFATGLGADATDTDGNIAASTRALINGLPATVQYAGRAPGFVGLNQWNIVLPAGLSSGLHRLRIGRNGLLSNETTIAIR